MSDKAPWLKKAVIYQILIDRFARGGGQDWLNPDHTKPVFCGGDLQGIIDRLDYLKNVGVNAILLSPFHPTTVYHGYHVLDLFGVDPRFGTLETVKALIRQAHGKGIKVFMDFVLNHVSERHPFFLAAKADPESQYRDWFHFTKWPDGYLSFLNFPDLPKLNLKNPEVKEHVAQAALHWLDAGFDGFRLDHIIGIPHGFFHEFREAVKSRNPEAVIFGEAVKGKIRWNEVKTLQLRHKHLLYLFGQLKINTTFFMQLQYVRDLDGVFDFFFRDMARSFLFHKRWYKPLWLLKIILKLHYRIYPAGFSLILLLDNADHDRFSFLLGGDKEELKKAVELQFSQKQPVIIFYGCEVGLSQTASRKYKVYGDKLNGDLAIRATMPWGRFDDEMLEFYKRIIKEKTR